MARTLGRTLGQLVLALINATLILIIVAALSLGYLVDALNDAAENGAARLSAAAVDAVGLDPDALRNTISSLREEVAALRTDLTEDDGISDAPALQRIEDQLDEISARLGQLANPTITVAPETVEAIGTTLDAVLQTLTDAPQRDDRP